MDSVTVRFTLSFREFASGIWTVTLRNPTTIVALSVAVVCAVLGAVSASEFLLWLGVAGLLGGFGGLAVLPLIRWRQSRLVRKEQAHTLSDGGVTISFEGAESRMAWDFYERVHWDGSLYLLLHTRRQFNIIPRRAFTAPDQEASFRALLARHVGFQG